MKKGLGAWGFGVGGISEGLGAFRIGGISKGLGAWTPSKNIVSSLAWLKEEKKGKKIKVKKN